MSSDNYPDNSKPPANPDKEIMGADVRRVYDPWEEWLDVAGITPARVADIQAAARTGDATEFLEFCEQILERDPAAAAHWTTLRSDIAGIPLQVHPAADDEKSQEIAEWIRVNVVDQESFQRLRWDLLDGAWCGYSVVELAFDAANDWQVHYQHRSPRFFTFDRATGSRLLRKTIEGYPDAFGNTDFGVPLTPSRFLVFAPRVKTGLIVRSGLAWPVMAMHLLASFALRYWMGLAEGHGRPIRVGTVPQDASAKYFADAKRALANMGYNASAVFRAGTKIEFPGANIEGHSEFHKTLSEYLGAQIALIILGSNFMNESGGSLAKANALGERLDNRALWFVQRLDACLNEQLIKLMVRIKFGDLEAYPEVHAMTDPAEDAAAVALSFSNVSKALGKPLPVREAELRKRLGFSEPEEGDRLAGGDEWGADGKPMREDLDAEQAKADQMHEAEVAGMSGGDGDGDGEDPKGKGKPPGSGSGK